MKTPGASAASSPSRDLLQSLETVGDGVLKWQAVSHISKRYPKVRGLLRLKQMYSDYVADRNYRAPYFGAKGERLLVRHGENERDVDEVAIEFADGVLRGGVRSDNRGKPVLIPTTPSPQCETFELLGGGTLADGVYRAHLKDPSNEQLQATIDQGLEGCVLLMYGTPLDVITEFIMIGNVDHAGTATTFTSGWRTAPKADRSWDAQKKTDGVTKRNCAKTGNETYAKKLHRHVLSEFEHIWQKPDHYDQCHESHSKLLELGIEDMVIPALGQCCIHNHKAMPDNSVLWAMANTLLGELDKHFSDLPKDTLAVLFFETFKLCCVTRDSVGQPCLPIITNTTHMKRLIKGFTCPMPLSAVYKKSPQCSNKPESNTTPKTDSHSPSRQLATVALRLGWQMAKRGPTSDGNPIQPKAARGRGSKTGKPLATGTSATDATHRATAPATDADATASTAATVGESVGDTTHAGAQSANPQPAAHTVTAAPERQRRQTGSAVTQTTEAHVGLPVVTPTGRSVGWPDDLAFAVQQVYKGFGANHRTWKDDTTHTFIGGSMRFFVTKLHHHHPDKRPLIKWSQVRPHIVSEGRKEVAKLIKESGDETLLSAGDDSADPVEVMSHFWIDEFTSHPSRVQTVLDFLDTNDASAPCQMWPTTMSVQSKLFASVKTFCVGQPQGPGMPAFLDMVASHLRREFPDAVTVSAINVHRIAAANGDGLPEAVCSPQHSAFSLQLSQI